MSYMGLGQPAFPVISAKTASYTVLPEDHMKVFSNRGASGAVTFTLPPIANVQAGWGIRVFVVAGQNVIVAAPSTKLTVFNNAAATSIAFQTASELIGNGVEIVYDGTTYLAFVNMASEGVTITIA